MIIVTSAICIDRSYQEHFLGILVRNTDCYLFDKFSLIKALDYLSLEQGSWGYRAIPVTMV